jgi:cysteinyl-tRNA synthetase
MLGVFGLENLLDADEAPEELMELARRREQARADRDFETADRLRDEIRAAGWEVRDGPEGPELVPAA